MREEPTLVPELAVTDCAASRRFWCGLLGAEILYERPDEGFAYLALDGAHIMLDQIDRGRTWRTGELETPRGRGLNLQIAVTSIDEVICRLHDAGWPLLTEPEERWYRTGESEAGVCQFLVQDPDGYLIRLQTSLGDRRATAPATALTTTTSAAGSH